MYGSVLSPVVPLLTAWTRRERLDRTFRLLTATLLIALVADLLNIFLAFMHINNLPVAHAYGLIEGILLVSLFGHLLGWKRSLTTLAIATYGIMYILDSVFFESIFSFNAWSRSVEALLMIALCIMSFSMFYSKEEDIFIEKSPHFWIVIGILTYFSGALFSFLLSTDMLSQSSERFYGSWMLHNFSNLLKNIIFTIGLWRIRPLTTN